MELLMAQDSPNDKRHVLVALLRPSPVSLAVCLATGGPRPRGIEASRITPPCSVLARKR